MITVTDIHTHQFAEIYPGDFADTVTPWFPAAPAEVTDAIAEVQKQLNAGTYTLGSPLAVLLGLDIQ